MGSFESFLASPLAHGLVFGLMLLAVGVGFTAYLMALSNRRAIKILAEGVWSVHRDVAHRALMEIDSKHRRLHTPNE